MLSAAIIIDFSFFVSEYLWKNWAIVEVSDMFMMILWLHNR